MPADAALDPRAVALGRRHAVVFILTATVFIALSMLCAKLVQSDTFGPGLPPLMSAGGRFVFAFVLMAMASLVLRPQIQRPHWRLHLMRTAFGGVGLTFMFTAVGLIPLADATAISFLNPVFAMLFAIAFLGESVGKCRWLAAAISLAGAVILLRPGAGVVEIGALFALGAAVIFGLEITVIKHLSALESPLQILLVNNALGTVLFAGIIPLVWVTPTPAQWLCLVGVGFTMGTAQACYINALRRAEASFVVPFSYAVLIFATAWDFLVFGVLPDAISYAGIAVILAGGALLAWREAVRA